MFWKPKHYQSDEKAKMRIMKGSAHEANHTSLSVKHGGGHAMAWVCFWNRLLINDLNYVGSSRIISEAYRTTETLPFANLQRNA